MRFRIILIALVVAFGILEEKAPAQGATFAPYGAWRGRIRSVEGPFRSVQRIHWGNGVTPTGGAVLIRGIDVLGPIAGDILSPTLITTSSFSDLQAVYSPSFAQIVPNFVTVQRVPSQNFAIGTQFAAQKSIAAANAQASAQGASADLHSQIASVDSMLARYGIGTATDGGATDAEQKYLKAGASFEATAHAIGAARDDIKAAKAAIDAQSATIAARRERIIGMESRIDELFKILPEVKSPPDAAAAPPTGTPIPLPPIELPEAARRPNK